MKSPANEEITRQILAWYDRNHRELPWRRTRDPYRIWVSEIMLQQTQVETVIPFYHRFLARFPTLQDLADASLDEVLKFWENMGYYARARHMHESAKRILRCFDGEIPRTWKELISLPGIGVYTAGSVLSIAYGQRVPAVDGNVRRVLSRIFAIDVPIDSIETERYLQQLARELLPAEDPGAFNQALMDLGAIVCSPKRPHCPNCPVQNLCLARKKGLQDILPKRRTRRPVPHVFGGAGVIVDAQGRMLVVRRPNTGLLGGLWKLPGGLQEDGLSLSVSLKMHINRELGIDVRLGRLLATVKHVYTHFRMTMKAYQCSCRECRPEALGCEDWHWAAPKDLHSLAFSKADRKVIDVLGLEVDE
jgi:A/G-specific adenine glycosylase